MNQFFHSVTLDKDKCMGCTNCIKRCPTEAIRVRGGKARIISERCIDCGECIRVCPHHAKKAKSDSLDMIQNFKYKIALPAPTLYGQFNNLDDIDIVLTGLKDIGFDEVFEVSRSAELVSEVTRKLMQEGKLEKPVISSACPAVVRLIRVRFPDLCSHVLQLNSPMETAARIAKREAMKKTGLPRSQIGAFFITPCPAKVTAIRMPISCKKSEVDGAIAISEIFAKLAAAMENVKSVEPLAHSGIIGVGWASSGGESSALLNDKYLAADGIENVIRVLEELEDEKIRELNFIELNACSGGCVGGVLCVENAYVAKARLQRLRRYLPVSQNHIDGKVPGGMKWQKNLLFTPVLKLSDDMNEALKMMAEIDKICEELPGLDCGSCGAPTCRALAEDIVRGFAKKNQCIFIMRKEIKMVADALSSMGTFPLQSDEEDKKS
ncbi:[Fe-Fe] hydrogenase large subunit C-terminal domain-containing protein [Caproiciproducens faecalis]|uniref:4Fe-4S binding protein n=1 Tax=Caproiciproducens faecalis TaxID=2820301 RepID=A0ABS7DML4_9FIRM|nr:[Fe-Fe] hydrogenase large subunit C-terminal domain-containing protein [Caproiciproducens faecalis]MBW7572545.1 4Fe-4S binding protein [Caproiciproducens faecalis]